MSIRWQLAAAGLAVVLALAGLWVAVRNSSFLALFEDGRRLVAWVQGIGPWGPLAIIVLQIGQVLLAPLPGQAVGIAAGLLFGPLLGTIYCWIGMAAGSWVAFRLARAYGRPLVERLVPRQTLTWLDEGARRRGLFFFAIVFLLPFLPDDLACFVAGLTAIPIPALMLVAITTRAPGILVSSWVGANAEGLSTTQWVLLVVGSALLAGLALLYGERLQPWLMARLAGNGRKSRSHPPSPGG